MCQAGGTSAARVKYEQAIKSMARSSGRGAPAGPSLLSSVLVGFAETPTTRALPVKAAVSDVPTASPSHWRHSELTIASGFPNSALLPATHNIGVPVLTYMCCAAWLCITRAFNVAFILSRRRTSCAISRRSAVQSASAEKAGRKHTVKVLVRRA